VRRLTACLHANVATASRDSARSEARTPINDTPRPQRAVGPTPRPAARRCAYEPGDPVRAENARRVVRAHSAKPGRRRRAVHQPIRRLNAARGTPVLPGCTAAGYGTSAACGSCNRFAAVTAAGRDRAGGDRRRSNSHRGHAPNRCTTDEHACADDTTAAVVTERLADDERRERSAYCDMVKYRLSTKWHCVPWLPALGMRASSHRSNQARNRSPPAGEVQRLMSHHAPANTACAHMSGGDPKG
jgi:hypothetical protein